MFVALKLFAEQGLQIVLNILQSECLIDSSKDIPKIETALA